MGTLGAYDGAMQMFIKEPRLSIARVIEPAVATIMALPRL